MCLSSRSLHSNREGGHAHESLQLIILYYVRCSEGYLKAPQTLGNPAAEPEKVTRSLPGGKAGKAHSRQREKPVQGH